MHTTAHMVGLYIYFHNRHLDALVKSNILLQDTLNLALHQALESVSPDFETNIEELTQRINGSVYKQHVIIYVKFSSILQRIQYFVTMSKVYVPGLSVKVRKILKCPTNYVS